MFRASRRVLSAMGSHVVWMGPAGAGTAAKVRPDTVSCRAYLPCRVGEGRGVAVCGEGRGVAVCGVWGVGCGVWCMVVWCVVVCDVCVVYGGVWCMVVCGVWCMVVYGGVWCMVVCGVWCMVVCGACGVWCAVCGV